MKKKLLALFMGISLVFVLGACGGGDDKSSDKDNGGGEQVSAGEKLFSEKGCATCHGQKLEGQGDTFPNLQKVGSRLDQAGIKEVIVNGRNQMPAQNVTDEEANTLAEWLAAKK
jgi:mono/diheme cytochrome c family protein